MKYQTIICLPFLAVSVTRAQYNNAILEKGGHNDVGFNVTNGRIPENAAEQNLEGGGGGGDQPGSEAEEIPQFENCYEYTERYGYECVPYYQCDNGTIITDGAGILDIRNGFGPENSNCPNDLDACCKDPDFVPPPPLPKPRFVPKCGRRNDAGLGPRIMGFNDVESQFGEWPHMCAVLFEQRIEAHQPEGTTRIPEVVNLFQCGGSLIAPGVVLTAAHCVKDFQENPARLKVRCGEWDTQSRSEPFPHQDRGVEKFSIHPEFDSKSLHNDFAVLIMAEDFDLSPHVDTICLPDPYETYSADTCYATGWGKDKFGAEGEYQVLLKEIDLPIVDNEECESRLRTTKLGQKFKLDDSFLCAGGVDGKDTCRGDGGSPLVCPSKGDPQTYTQAGIVSWGVGCGEDGSPGVYASVSQAVCWIDHVLSCNSGFNSSQLGIDTSTCQKWMDDKISELEGKKDGAKGKVASEFGTLINKFMDCKEIMVEVTNGTEQEENEKFTEDNTYKETVEAETENYLDTNNNGGYGGTENTSEKLEDLNTETDGYGQNEGYVEPTDGYEKLENIASEETTNTYKEPDNTQEESENSATNAKQTDTETNSEQETDGYGEQINQESNNTYEETGNKYEEPDSTYEEPENIATNAKQTDGETDPDQEAAGYGEQISTTQESVNSYEDHSDTNEESDNIASNAKQTDGEVDSEQETDGYGNQELDSTTSQEANNTYGEPDSTSENVDNTNNKQDSIGTNAKQTNNETNSEQETGGYEELESFKDTEEEDTEGYVEPSYQETEDHVPETETYQPDDYVEPDTAEALTDHSTTEIDTLFENCADYTESQGYECVPYYQCHNGTIITDGAGLIDVRNGFGVLTPEDSKCPGFLDVCCKDPDFIPPPPPKFKYSPTCGRRNQNGLGVRIQGFSEAESQFGEWPHMCAVLHEKVGEQDQVVNLFQCGGSLIAPGVILTAAHCVDKFRATPTELKIRCGEWDTQNQTEPYPHQDRKVQEFKIHPLFDPRSLANDWAVLFTAEEFVLSSHIDTTCLPQAEELFEGNTCFATGWGKDKFGIAGEYQVVLKEIDLPVVGYNTCQDLLRKTRLGGKFKLDESFICAGGIDGRDTCKGDGGSPLVCPSKNNPNTYVQAGIVAWGIGCGEDNTPGVYASVSKAVCWIDYVMSCYYGDQTGDYNSYWGYSNVCAADQNNLIANLEAKRDGAGKFGTIFQNMINELNTCTVFWEAPAAPLVDVSTNERDSYADTSADQTKGAEDGYSADQTKSADQSVSEEPETTEATSNGSYK